MPSQSAKSIIVISVDLLEELIGEPLEGHAGAHVPLGHEAGSGCGVILWFGKKGCLIDILNVSI
eukprot:6122719-Pyramimonas_sp.AAC.1